LAIFHEQEVKKNLSKTKHDTKKLKWYLTQTI